ncbi:hypothetical protein [Aquirufa aurantiipilula]|uniref:hypothetical protein n=1 Tax=Aquirufa aurantiipilula TaxID=2696561 RepID=UPI001CAA58B3|nr:hypothetical protein [Aquirufa aurantiipilula]MBZ1326553.1 hypothetical protein [Aquirufa aurantiipilula]
MKTYIFTASDGSTYQVFPQVGEYKNSQTALELISTLDGSTVLTASISIPEIALGKNELIIKDYSENEGVLSFLVENNIVRPLGKYIENGLITAEIVELVPENHWK